MDTRLNRRNLLKGLGLAGIGGLAGTAGLAGFSRPAHAAPRLKGVATCTFDCVVTPSVTEGPYYFDANQVRSDITEGLPGAPLLLTVGLVNAETCEPIADAVIDVWHASASGLYSGYNQPDGDARGEDFFRGIQITDANGEVQFATVYPGWYRGRAVHIHFKIRFDQSTYLISQLFFPQETSNALFTSEEPYRARGLADTTNDRDGIYRRASDREQMMLTVAENSETGGYTASIVIGVSGLETALETTPPTPQPALTAPFPNPTPSVATLWLTLPRAAGHASVGLFDALGRERARVHDGPLVAGRHPVEVDASALPPGTYVVRADVGTTVLVEAVAVERL